MFNERNKLNFVTIYCWLSLLSLSTKSSVQALSIQKAHTNDNDIDHGELIGHSHGNGNGNALQSDATVHNFSPRLEYNNEWRPVGRGDPLKNDPTYDYSPPALERVRYWRADNESKDELSNSKQFKKENSKIGKKEILLLGMSNERQRGQSIHSETSVLQPKYTSIRRSYFSHQHQLPTHLMPPPMQTLAPPAHLMKSSAAVEYRHSMPSSTTTMSMMHSKPYYSTAASPPWMHTSMSSMPTSISSSPVTSMQHYRQQSNPDHMHFNRDHHHQETINQFTYTRPSLGTSFTSNNFIESNQNSLKPRKPWLHELLQKEVVKVPSKPVVHKYSTNYEQMSPLIGISTTHPPVAFVPLPTTTPQTTMSTTTQVFTTTSPVYFTTTMATTSTTPRTPIISSPASPTSNRLLIPTTSNLVHRPTVMPMKMVTESFKHYKQPVKPLLGPMYLIIEGHSKVKTYGKDELDPHRPKIVPIIPKREPVVRIADPNEKRGTLESFQVKHLHTKATTPFAELTQSTTSKTMTKTTTKPTTTNKPKISMLPNAEISKVNLTVSTPTATITTTKTVQPTSETTKTSSQLSTDEPPTGMQGFFSFLDSSLGSLFHEEPIASEIGEVDSLNSPQDKLIFVTTTPSATILLPIATTTPKTPQIEARIGTRGSSIESLIDFDDVEADGNRVTTEPVPRDVRQVFDYDQLPESRLKDRMDVNSNENDDNADANEEGVIALHDDSLEGIDMDDVESLAPDEYEDENHELIKRIDKLVDDIDEDDNEFEELISAEVDADDDLEMRRTKEA